MEELFVALRFVVEEKIRAIEENLGMHYIPKNSFSPTQKYKILLYLESKQKRLEKELKGKPFPKHRTYSFNDDEIPLEFRMQWLRIQLKNAEDSKAASEQALSLLQLQVLSEQSYEFNWAVGMGYVEGFMIGAFICGFILVKAKPFIKAMVFVVTSHYRGLHAYHRHLDRYFDSLYPFFTQDAAEWLQKEANDTTPFPYAGPRPLSDLH